jgi:hypothetical protein
MFLSVVILGRFTTETHAMALLNQDRHAATTYTTPRDVPPTRYLASASHLRPGRERSVRCWPIQSPPTDQLRRSPENGADCRSDSSNYVRR